VFLRDALIQSHNEIKPEWPPRQARAGCFCRKNSLPENPSTTSPNGVAFRQNAAGLDMAMSNDGRISYGLTLDHKWALDFERWKG
jgi:hypothetical protein